jgi:hypothetical protein
LTEGEARIVATAEADLQRLLSIDPSPEFAARVRSRINENRRARTTMWAWVGLGLAAATTVVLVVALGTDPSSSTPQNVTVTHDDIPLRSPAPPADLSVASIASSTPVVTQRQSERSVRGRGAPEIIIDAAMTDAIRRMAMAVRNTKPDTSVAETLQVGMGDPAALAVAAPLRVPELVLTPVDQSGGDQDLFEQDE